MTYIPINELKDGAYYFGQCRNATIARWNAADQQFYHWREKFSDRFVETIRHPDNEPNQRLDIFYPFEEVTFGTEEIPF
jgi:hypothetical protein